MNEEDVPLGVPVMPPLSMFDKPREVLLGWRDTQTAKCCGGHRCPIQDASPSGVPPGTFDVIRVGYVESLHARIAHLERELAKAMEAHEEP